MRMKAVGFPVFALVPFLVVSSAQAQKPLIEGIPPGVWKWYQADFRDVGIDPPIIWFGDATVDIDKATIRTQMKLIPFNKDLHPFFRGKINAKTRSMAYLAGYFSNRKTRRSCTAVTERKNGTRAPASRKRSPSKTGIFPRMCWCSAEARRPGVEVVLII